VDEKYIEKLKWLYQFVIATLSIVSVIIAIIDIATGINSVTAKNLDFFILLIFTFDYIVRFVISKQKITFLKQNIFDLIAIIPFSELFRMSKFLKVIKITHLFKLAKFIRLISFFARAVSKCKIFFKTNGFHYILAITVLAIIMGAVGISFAEGMNFEDGLWWAFVTATTVGYGDLSPDTNFGRIIAVLLMLIGIGLIGSLTSTITSFFLNKPNTKKDFRTQTIKNIQSKLEHFEDLSTKDVEDICTILKSLKVEP
jgi:voltage-gated potassium channel